MNRKVWFYRNFQEFTGGHLKHAHYFANTQKLPGCDAAIVMNSADLVLEQQAHELWSGLNQCRVTEWSPNAGDVFFMAGDDWRYALKFTREYPQNPCINLIQHVRHANPQGVLYEYLKHKAIRVCVSPEVSEAIAATGVVNGPIITISNGLDFPEVPPLQKQWDLLILGPKNPQMALAIQEALKDQPLRIVLINNWVARDELLAAMSKSRIVMALPHETEGFYLPALEAMKYADLLIVPDCVGNRSFCRHQFNCLFPAYNKLALLAALDEGIKLLLNEPQRLALQINAAKTLLEHSMQREFQKYSELMSNIDEYW